MPSNAITIPGRGISAADLVRELPMDRVAPDPDQPRKLFDTAGLHELAASIHQNGLLQPITVRSAGPEAFLIVAGERRWRAHQLLEEPTIRAIVIEPADTAEVRVKQIIENDQRVDVTPLEHARSYQALMELTGWTVEELARAIGKSPWRVTERTALLRLRPEYQQLLERGQMKPSEGTELARLSPRCQDVLFKAIKEGRCANYNDLRAAATALVQAEAQASLIGDLPPPPTAEERHAARTFEDKVARAAALLRQGIHDNQVVALHKVNPSRASTLADLLAAMQRDIRRIEVALREVAIQQDLLGKAGANETTLH
jgi:ParB family chromosome partitioning protein